MNLKELIRAPKTDVELSKWSRGRIPRNAFPQSLVKERWYRVGQSYHWRTVKFRADGKDCRVLILVNEDKSIFRARLGVEDNGDMIITVQSTLPGQARSDTYKWPQRIVHDMFPITRQNAFDRVAKVFRISSGGTLI